MTIAEIQELLSKPKDKNLYLKYQELYKQTTGKNYKRNCTNCAVNFLYKFLTKWYKNK